jgi:dUTP pyrophosphatase
MELRFKRLEHGEGLPLPAYATAGAAAMDICSAEDSELYSGKTVMVSTGFAVAVPEGYELQVRPRSGMASKGITIVNSPGTVDSDYRGEIKILLQNTNPSSMAFGSPYPNKFDVFRGDRIAQLVLAPVTQAVPIEVTELDETTRGANGFGSTGRN